MQKGFTLVELSIVLVIIGLLIGGILVAQSLIESAKISRTISEVQQYAVMVSNFKEKFKDLPGDSKKFTTNGNGDGVVTDGTADESRYFRGEIANSWKHLAEAEMASRDFSSSLISGVLTVGGNFPKISIAEDTGLLMGTVTIGNAVHGTAFPVNTFIFQIHGSYPDDNLTANGSNRRISTIQALSLDKKMDDGIADNGNVRVVSAYFGGKTISTYGCVETGDISVYDLADTDERRCQLGFDVFSQLGQ